MDTFRPFLSPAARLFRFQLLAITMLCLVAGFSASAQTMDQVGIFWDSGYTQDSTETATFPEVLTGYLVLKDPSTSAGILGWEACVDIDGPAQFISWTLEGQNINAAPPPCFKVGIGGPPLPSTGDVLLATFQVLVNEPLPITLSLRPDYQPSVPGEMSYIPADFPETLRPMATPTGDPEVAWINGQIPNLVVSHTTLHFDNVPVGTSSSNFVTVSNEGGIPGDLDIFLTGDCAPFSLPDVSGQVTIQPGESVVIQVEFTAQNEEYFLCNLALGGMLDEVQMVGNGVVPDISWEAPTLVDFGPAPVGEFVNRIIRIRNTGDVPFYLDPSIAPSCTEFRIGSGNYPSTISPGSTRSIGVVFEPTVVGEATCQLDLGGFVPAVELTGIGGNPAYDWSIFPPILDFGTVGIGYTQNITLSVQNTGNATIPIVPEISAGCPEFTFIQNGDPFNLPPGATYGITVQFAPQATSQVFCDLGLGDVIPDVPMTGVGREAVLAWLAPTEHDFGTVSVGQMEPFTFLVFNSGDIPFDVAPSLPETATNFDLTQGSLVTLQPGMSTEITVVFWPLVPGADAVALDLGPTVPPVQLQGVGDPLPEAWVVSPMSLDFGWIYLGTYREMLVNVQNTGGTFLDMDIQLQNTGLGFSIAYGGGIIQLAPGHQHDILVRFQPQAVGPFVTVLNMGSQVSPVPISGSAEETSDICIFEPDSLIFGPVNVGSSQARSVAVTNNGNQSITLWPSTDASQFTTSGNTRTLGPGQTAYFSVTFQSGQPGTFTGNLDLGTGVCSGVPLVGTAVIEGAPDEDLVGIFFDPNFTSIEAQTFGPNEVVVGFLVLTEPSETTGVSAWELKASIDGDATWLNWAIEGQHINVGQGDEFIVGIGGDPLPPSEAILLATFQIFIPQPYPNIVYLELGPIYQASLPDQMVWAPGHDASILKPMFPLTGQKVVAGINWGPPVGIGNPAPRARLTGHLVELEWPVPAGTNEGCHVYRRDDAGGDFRLTDQPLRSQGPVLEFSDNPSGYAPGAVLNYSYSVVKNGVEGVRSPETEIRLAGVPAVQTRLLPNVPNPFNPQTEIRFELEKAQQVKVAVYDMTGRLVKVLADGQLGAGPHARVWQGRDTGGRQVPSGAYYVRLIVQGRVDHQKIMLLK
jgi:hypothetical protein